MGYLLSTTLSLPYKSNPRREFYTDGFGIIEISAEGISETIARERY